MDLAETYDELADQYHLIFENWELSVERQAAVLSSILDRNCGLATTARILDCACGIGTQALGLSFMRRAQGEQWFIEHPNGIREVTGLTLTSLCRFALPWHRE